MVAAQIKNLYAVNINPNIIVTGEAEHDVLRCTVCTVKRAGVGHVEADIKLSAEACVGIMIRITAEREEADIRIVIFHSCVVVSVSTVGIVFISFVACFTCNIIGILLNLKVRTTENTVVVRCGVVGIGSNAIVNRLIHREVQSLIYI